MNVLNIYKALYTCTMLIPLMFLCIYPVRDYIRSRTSAMFLRFAIRLAIFFVLAILLSYLTILPSKFLIAMCAGVYFFYFYQQQVELPLNKSLFIFLTVYMISGFSRIFTTLVDLALHPENTYHDISIEGFLFQLVFLILMDLILYVPFTRYLGWLVAHFHSKIIWNFVCTFPFLCIVLTYVLVPHNYRWMYIGRALLMYLSVIASLIILILLLYALFYQFVHTFIEKQKLEHSNELLQVQGAQYQQLLRSVQENSRIRHDFRHQLVVISELLNQKDYDKLNDYVASYIQDAPAELKIYSYSPALNAILSYYESICQDRKIKTDFSLYLPSELPVTDQDLCVMLGNLLENAVYGCENMAEPYIRLKIMQTSSNMLAVKIRNPYAGTAKNVNGSYLSSRHSGVGQGLESVNIIAQKYQGCMDVQTEQQVFTVKVLLQLATGA